MVVDTAMAAAHTLAKVMAQITARRHLNPKHRHRSYPRVVKRARHNHYHVKTTTGTGTIAHPLSGSRRSPEPQP
jgi:hypothetical protein